MESKCKFRCCVPRCTSKYYRKERRDTHFFGLPNPQRLHAVHTKRLAQMRLNAWRNVISSTVSTKAKICNKHFVSGAPSPLTDTANVDWIPSLFMTNDGVDGYRESLMSKLHEGIPVSILDEDTSSKPLNNVDAANDSSSCEEPDDGEVQQIEQESIPDSTDLGQTILIDEIHYSADDSNEPNDPADSGGVNPENQEASEEVSEIKEEEIEIQASDFSSGLEDQAKDPIASEPTDANEDETEVIDDGESTNSSEETLSADETAQHISDHAYHQKQAETKKLKVAKRNIAKLNVAKSKERIHDQKQVLPQNIQGLLRTHKSLHLCLECGERFKSMFTYLKHHSNHTHSKENYLSCQYCAQKFQFEADRQNHLMCHTKLEAFTCCVCNFKVYSAGQYFNHLDIHRLPNIYYKCKICTLRFSSCKQLDAHLLAIHPLQNVINKNLARTVYICFHCGWIEKTWGGLTLHMRQHSGPFQCQYCSSTLDDSEKFAKHASTVHNDRGELTYYRCTNASCTKEFVSLRKLQMHESDCLPQGGEYQCEICLQNYRELDHLASHIRLHEILSNEAQNKSCTECRFETISPAAYAQHMVEIHGFRDTVAALEKYYLRASNMLDLPYGGVAAASMKAASDKNKKQKK
ncbi:zinc finger Y-chromosomal protein-like isoform X2 [Topomyia yanbarensis]|uniref:zinc finger Y-chromosomal protein-like isoform X2 n=1 Tax=Topomyia yanbarensis TaxID=2498891 RepID=UPI00273AC0BD|nr:zinc finger Y-chromosomal protein-like isoform X2 [Topomyia yanbarensis]